MVAGRKSRVASWEPAGCADLLIRIFCFCLQRSGLCGADLQIGMICHFALNTSEISIPRSFFQSCFIRYVPNPELLEPASPATLRSHLQRSPMVSGHPLPGASRTFGPALPWADHNRAYSPPFIDARQPFFLSLGVGIAIAFETLY